MFFIPSVFHFDFDNPLQFGHWSLAVQTLDWLPWRRVKKLLERVSRTDIALKTLEKKEFINRGFHWAFALSPSLGSSPSKRSVVYEGINPCGNPYKVYNDGAFAYKNTNGKATSDRLRCFETETWRWYFSVDGSTGSRYYNTGKGHAFYANKNEGYTFHENQNKGTRTYKQKKDK